MLLSLTSEVASPTRTVETGTMTETLRKDEATTTDLSMSDMQHLDALEKECYHLRSENSELKESISHNCLSEKTLEGDDEKVKFYTGLPSFATLMTIFHFVSSHIILCAGSTSRSLPLFQQFLLVLMKLRLNL